MGARGIAPADGTAPPHAPDGPSPDGPSQTPHGRGGDHVPWPRRGLVRLWDRTSLRVKLVAGMLVVATVGMTVMAAASASVLRQYLIGRADDQLRGSVGRTMAQVAEHLPELEEGQTRFTYRIPSEVYGQIRVNDGRMVAHNPAWSESGHPRLPDDLSGKLDRPFTVSGTGGSGSSWRILAEPIPEGDGAILVLAFSLEEADRTVRRLVVIDAIVGLVVLIGLVGLGVGVVRASLRPLAEIEETAGAIAAGDLSRRVPRADPRTEMGRLARSLNAMLAQIEAAFRARAESEAAARRSERTALRSQERMRRFVADASHELRTPLTAIRGFAEFYRQGAARTPAELDRLIGRIEQTAARMGLLVEDLLLLARLDQQRPIERRPVDLLAVAADSVQEARVLAPDRTIDLSVEGGLAYQVLGDELRLRQVLGNLLTNAVVHTPPGTPVEVRLTPGTLRDAPAAVLEVADEGPGLSPEQAERVFERFYRADEARSREGGGAGLGLAIVAALVAAHDGHVEADSAPGEGARFRVVLPLDGD